MGLVGVIGATILYHLIMLVTNLAYYHRWSMVYVEVNQSPLKDSVWMIVMVLLGALLAAIVIHYVDQSLSGHGIPEAMDAVLYNKSRIQLKTAILKPIMAAIVIGTGSPFAAEGPIIQTGGAWGAHVGKWLHMDEHDRKILLGAGAAAGMTGIFATPLAGVLLAIELLIFEYSPQAVIPIVIAAGLAEALRSYVMPKSPVFPSHVVLSTTIPHIGWIVIFGIIAGIESWLLIRGLYGTEDLLKRLLGSLEWLAPVVGAAGVAVVALLGGTVALGMGYDVIREVLKTQHIAMSVLLIAFVAKAVAWTVALASGSVGGVLAPVFFIAGTSGALMGHLFMPWTGFSPIVGALVFMGAVFGATTGALLSSIAFAVEATGDPSMLWAVMLATAIAYGIVRVTLPYNMMTGKLVRRGHRVPDTLGPISKEETDRQVAGLR